MSEEIDPSATECLIERAGERAFFREAATGEHGSELLCALQELEQWKRVAAYLATCHAATLEGLPKSASKSQRARMVSICTKAAAYLRREDLPPYHYNPANEINREAERCEQAAQKYAV